MSREAGETSPIRRRKRKGVSWGKQVGSGGEAVQRGKMRMGIKRNPKGNHVPKPKGGR